jgi:hypothetical protein
LRVMKIFSACCTGLGRDVDGMPGLECAMKVLRLLFAKISSK